MNAASAIMTIYRSRGGSSIEDVGLYGGGRATKRGGTKSCAARAGTVSVMTSWRRQRQPGREAQGRDVPVTRTRESRRA